MNSFKHILLGFSLIMIFLFGCSNLSSQQKEALVELLDLLTMTIEDTEDMLVKDNEAPPGPYRALMDRLKSMKDHIDRIKSGESEFDETAVLKYSGEISDIQDIIRNSLEKVLQTDIFFKLGKSRIEDLSDEGKQTLDRFAMDVIDLQVKKLRKIFPAQHLTIIIKSIGYADETPFSSDGTRDIEKEITGPLPDDPVEKRKFLNKALSLRRSQSINDYVNLRLKTFLDMENVGIGSPNVIGNGEGLPYPIGSVSPEYQAKDERRRICKIFSKISLID